MQRYRGMDSLASTAIYLASSLTIAHAPRTVDSAPTATVISRPIAREGKAASADILVNVNPFALARSRGGKSLSEAIADEVRRDALDSSAGNAETTLLLDSERDDVRDRSLTEDVAATHDARIDFITRRMEELRLKGPSAAPLLSRLDIKLHMAIAARRLAVAREAIGNLPVDCAPGVDFDACRSAPIAVAANTVTDHRRARHTQPRRSGVSHHTASATTLAASVLSSPSNKAASGATERHFGVDTRHMPDIHRDPARWTPDRLDQETARPSASVLLAARKATRHGSAEGATGDASDHARRLLAAARRLLENDAASLIQPDIKLAGLLHWEGSETWSLANYPRSTI